MKSTLALIVALLGAVLFYSNIMNNEFVFDDHDIIRNNKAIRELSDLKTVLTTNYWHEQANAGLYRPLIFLLYAIDYAFWGLNPSGYHLFNLLFHLLTCLMVWYLARSFLIDRTAVFFAVLLFAVHPVHIEAVTGIVGRAEVVGTFFFCLSWWLFVRQSMHGRYTSKGLIASSAAYFLALTSKENTFVLPAVIALTVLFFDTKPDRWKKAFFSTIPYIVVFGIYMIIRFRVIGSIGPQGSEQFFYEKPWFTVFLTMIRVFAFYIKLFLIPTDLLATYRMWDVSTSLLDWRVLVSLPIVAGWVAGAVWFFKSRKIWQLMLLVMLITLFPVSNIVIAIGDIMAERFLYLPSVAFCIVAGPVLVSLVRRASPLISARLSRLIPLIIVVLFGVGMLVRNAQWRDGIIFWKTTIRQIPNSYSAYTNLAFSYADRKMFSHATAAVERALRIKPDSYVSRKLLTRLFYETGNYDQAITQSLRLIDLDSRNYFGYEYLALSLMQKQQMEKALEVCRSGIQVALNAQPLYHTLIRIYLNTGELKSALDAAHEALRNDPRDVTAYLKAASVYEQLGNDASAVDYYRKALDLDNANLEALDKLASLQFNLGNYNKARFYWHRAIKKYPSRDYFWYYIGLAYEREGNIPAARKSWQMIFHSDTFKQRAAIKLQHYAP